MRRKTCTRCGRRRLEKMFNRDSRKPDGRRSACFECTRDSDQAYTAQPEVREHRRLVAEDWWSKHGPKRNRRRKREARARRAT